MKTNNLEIKSITIKTETLETILKGEGPPLGLLAVLEFFKEAMDKRTPIYVEDARTGNTSKWTDEELSEIG